jgi:hypothetical protein
MADTRDEDLVEKEKALTTEIETLLPDFARSCRGSEDVILIHQDSFTADYEDHEYTLFGKAIKFAGLHGKEVRVIGTNRETLDGQGHIPTINGHFAAPKRDPISSPPMALLL